VTPDQDTTLLSKSMRGLYIGAASFLGVIALGTTAYRLEGWKLLDAFYMVIITVFSVGYEEVEPVTTVALHAITMLIIVAGDACKVYFVGSLVQVITGGAIGRAMEEHRKSRDIENMTEHAIICGYGRIGQTLARELHGADFPFLIVDNNAERVALAHTHGYQALVGDGGSEETMNEAHIERAVVLATVLPSDMVNVFITLTARNMRPDLRIIARAEDPATEKKLRQAGANEIILPAFVGGMQIANSITHPSLGSMLKEPVSQERPEGAGRGDRGALDRSRRGRRPQDAAATPARDRGPAAYPWDQETGRVAGPASGVELPAGGERCGDDAFQFQGFVDGRGAAPCLVPKLYLGTRSGDGRCAFEFDRERWPDLRFRPAMEFAIPRG
jgi:voltage-gated potassium channel